MSPISQRCVCLCCTLAILAAVFYSAACGSSATEGAPPVSIPAPVVTKVTISTPTGGKSTITGTAGAATAGNTVRAQNLTQEGVASRWESLLWGIAYAATTVQTTAAADGSFTMEIDAKIGDRIRLTQLNSQGTTSTAATVTAPYQPLALGFVPGDIAVDPDSATAYIIGQSGGNGVVTPLNYGATPAFGTQITLPAQCNAPTAVAVDGARDRLIVVDNTNGTVCAQPQGGAAGALLATLAVTPVNVAIDTNTSQAVITNNSGQAVVAVTLLNLANDTVATVSLPNPVGGKGQTGTPSVATASFGGTNYAVVIVSYDAEEYAFVINLGTQAIIGTGSALSVTTPRELRLYNNTQGILVDADGRVHFLTIFVAGGSVSINRSLNVGSDPLGVDIDATTNRAFVANRGGDTLSVITLNTAPEAVSATLDSGDQPKQLGFKDAATNQLTIIHQDQTVIVLSN